MSYPRGEEVHGELSSADASGGVEISLFRPNGGSRTLGAAERLVVTDLVVVAEAGGDVRIFLDADDDDALDAGEQVFRGKVGVNGGVAFNFLGTPRYGAPGAKPHALAPAGQLDVTLTGFILQT